MLNWQGEGTLPFPAILLRCKLHGNTVHLQTLILYVPRYEGIRQLLFNLAVGLDGYTISTGIISKELNGENIIARPLAIPELIRVGTVTRKNMTLSRLGTAYMEALRRHTFNEP